MSPAYSPTLGEEYARRTDPQTSHTAGMESRAYLEGLVMDAVRRAGEHGCTTDEAWHATTAYGSKARPNSIARRLTTLAGAGLVVKVGTRPGDSGRQQTVWRIA